MQPQIISWDKVSRYIYRQDTLIVDLRDRADYEKGHITGAWNIPYEELENYRKQMSNYEQVIFYCANGSHSLLAAKSLAKQGKKAYSVAGGYNGRE